MITLNVDQDAIDSLEICAESAVNLILSGTRKYCILALVAGDTQTASRLQLHYQYDKWRHELSLIKVRYTKTKGFVFQSSNDLAPPGSVLYIGFENAMAAARVNYMAANP